MGPSVGWIIRPEAALLPITSAGTTTLARGTTLVTINVNGLVTINLPSSLASPEGPQAIPGQWVLNPVTIVDIGGFVSFSNTVTIVPNGSETISGQPSVDMTTPYGSVILKPILETGGWTLIQ
jgi:hypothetical protein